MKRLEDGYLMMIELESMAAPPIDDDLTKKAHELLCTAAFLCHKWSNPGSQLGVVSKNCPPLRRGIFR